MRKIWKKFNFWRENQRNGFEKSKIIPIFASML